MNTNGLAKREPHPLNLAEWRRLRQLQPFFPLIAFGGTRSTSVPRCRFRHFCGRLNADLQDDMAQAELVSVFQRMGRAIPRDWQAHTNSIISSRPRPPAMTGTCRASGTGGNPKRFRRRQPPAYSGRWLMRVNDGIKCQLHVEEYGPGCGGMPDGHSSPTRCQA